MLVNFIVERTETERSGSNKNRLENLLLKKIQII